MEKRIVFTKADLDLLNAKFLNDIPLAKCFHLTDKFIEKTDGYVLIRIYHPNMDSDELPETRGEGFKELDIWSALSPILRIITFPKKHVKALLRWCGVLTRLGEKLILTIFSSNPDDPYEPFTEYEINPPIKETSTSADTESVFPKGTPKFSIVVDGEKIENTIGIINKICKQKGDRPNPIKLEFFGEEATIAIKFNIGDILEKKPDQKGIALIAPMRSDCFIED